MQGEIGGLEALRDPSVVSRIQMSEKKPESLLDSLLASKKTYTKSDVLEIIRQQIVTITQEYKAAKLDKNTYKEQYDLLNKYYDRVLESRANMDSVYTKDQISSYLERKNLVPVQLDQKMKFKPVVIDGIKISQNKKGGVLSLSDVKYKSEDNLEDRLAEISEQAQRTARLHEAQSVERVERSYVNEIARFNKKELELEKKIDETEGSNYEALEKIRQEIEEAFKDLNRRLAHWEKQGVKIFYDALNLDKRKTTLIEKTEKRIDRDPWATAKAKISLQKQADPVSKSVAVEVEPEPDQRENTAELKEEEIKKKLRDLWFRFNLSSQVKGTSFVERVQNIEAIKAEAEDLKEEIVAENIGNLIYRSHRTGLNRKKTKPITVDKALSNLFKVINEILDSKKAREIRKPATLSRLVEEAEIVTPPKINKTPIPTIKPEDLFISDLVGPENLKQRGISEIPEADLFDVDELLRQVDRNPVPPSPAATIIEPILPQQPAAQIANSDMQKQNEQKFISAIDDYVGDQITEYVPPADEDIHKMAQDILSQIPPMEPTPNGGKEDDIRVEKRDFSKKRGFWSKIVDSIYDRSADAVNATLKKPKEVVSQYTANRNPEHLKKETWHDRQYYRMTGAKRTKFKDRNGKEIDFGNIKLEPLEEKSVAAESAKQSQVPTPLTEPIKQESVEEKFNRLMVSGTPEEIDEMLKELK